jgi:hypothetical protein
VAAMTFLELTNRVIDESRVALDQLTSANFASPPRTSMYGRIKNWLNTSLVEIYEDRPDWQFRIERTVVDIYPRLYVYVNPAYTPTIGDTFVGASSGVTFTVTGVHGLTEEADNNAATETTVSVLFTNSSDPTTLIMRENFNKTGVSPVTAALTLLGLGRYTFTDLVPGLERIDTSTLKAHYTPADAVLHGESLVRSSHPITELPWAAWEESYEMYPFTGSPFPRYISETPEGNFALYPYPDRQIDLSFDYRRLVTQMAVFSDTPGGLPDRYHMYLVWRTIAEMADYDSNPKLYARAKKHVDKYEYLMFRDELPRIRMSGWDGVYTSE